MDLVPPGFIESFLQWQSTEQHPQQAPGAGTEQYPYQVPGSDGSEVQGAASSEAILLQREQEHPLFLPGHLPDSLPLSPYRQKAKLQLVSTFTVTSGCSCSNFLLTGAEEEPWLLSPPVGAGDTTTAVGAARGWEHFSQPASPPATTLSTACCLRRVQPLINKV